MRVVLDFMLGVILRVMLLSLCWRAPRPIAVRMAGPRWGAIENDAERATYTLISERSLMERS
jgi:hypothetical protein